ncbi:TPA: hypothetical protein HA241_07185 [Candidatus Woesearchaeota archaeon]|nr:hypothetical protein [Candidatus Woesearchaeota archaeon]
MVTDALLNVSLPPTEILSVFQPVVDTIQPLLIKISLLVGGLFGIYVILLLARVYYERKKVHILEDIRYDLDRLNMHYNIGYSAARKGVLSQLICNIKSHYINKRIMRDHARKHK